MALVEKRGQQHLHDGRISDAAWKERFRQKHCDSWSELRFPRDQHAAEKLRRELAASSKKTVLVHVDKVEDGLGARVKKAVELVVAAARLGFHGVALAIPPEGSLLHPAGGEGWSHGPVWCHESPADGPDPPDPRQPDFPLVCWRFDLMADLFAQSPDPETRSLLWGAPPGEETLSGTAAAKFDCQHFQDGALKDDDAWQLHRREGPAVKDPRAAEPLRRVFGSVRAFAAVRSPLPGRRAVRCGFADAGAVHVAMHVRRGDVSEGAGYSVPQQLGAAGLSQWLCDLAAALRLEEGSKRLLLHVYTEASGRSRAALRRSQKRGTLPGFKFKKQPDDGVAPVYHTTGTLEVAPQCGDVVSRTVHFAVNDNPREALMCMARADVLVTSFSSMGWVSAMLSEGTVFHPDANRAEVKSENHWDLRYDYMDWAPNWFRVGEVASRADAIRGALGSTVASV